MRTMRGRTKKHKIVGLPPNAESVRWLAKGPAGDTEYVCAIAEIRCGACGKRAVVELPPPVRELQTDGTTHVCHPSFGGCNQGYAFESDPGSVS